MFFEQFYTMKWTIINSLNRSNKFIFEQEKIYILITKNYCVTKAIFGFRWFASLSLCTNCHIFASGGALQYFSLIDIPMMCLQM